MVDRAKAETRTQRASEPAPKSETVTVKQATAALAAFRRHKGYAQPVKAMTEAIKAARG